VDDEPASEETFIPKERNNKYWTTHIYIYIPHARKPIKHLYKKQTLDYVPIN